MTNVIKCHFNSVKDLNTHAYYNIETQSPCFHVHGENIFLQLRCNICQCSKKYERREEATKILKHVNKDGTMVFRCTSNLYVKGFRNKIQ